MIDRDEELESDVEAEDDVHSEEWSAAEEAARLKARLLWEMS